MLPESSNHSSSVPCCGPKVDWRISLLMDKVVVSWQCNSNDSLIRYRRSCRCLGPV